MARRFTGTFDAADPAALGAFWAEALGYVEQPPPDGFDDWPSFLEAMDDPVQHQMDAAYAIVDADGEGPRVYFQKVPESKAGKNRVHLDVQRVRGPAAGRRRAPRHRTRGGRAPGRCRRDAGGGLRRARPRHVGRHAGPRGQRVLPHVSGPCEGPTPDARSPKGHGMRVGGHLPLDDAVAHGPTSSASRPSSCTCRRRETWRPPLPRADAAVLREDGRVVAVHAPYLVNPPSADADGARAVARPARWRRWTLQRRSAPAASWSTPGRPDRTVMSTPRSSAGAKRSASIDHDVAIWVENTAQGRAAPGRRRRGPGAAGAGAAGGVRRCAGRRVRGHLSRVGG